MPTAARGLHHLLFTPFRYRPLYPGSRFRKPNDPRGVFYAGETAQAALAERAFYTLLGMAESIADDPPRWRGRVSVFAVPVESDRAVDLTRPPFDAHRETWIEPAAYAGCQCFAETARAADSALIRTESARDPDGHRNVAVFDTAAFARPRPDTLATWHLDADAHGVRAIEDFAERSLMFPRTAFDRDPRLAPLQTR